MITFIIVSVLIVAAAVVGVLVYKKNQKKIDADVALGKSVINSLKK